MALTTQEHLNAFRAALDAKMAECNPRTDEEIDAEYGADDQPEDEN